MKIVAITTTKTSRAKDSQEYFLSDYEGDYDKALAAARADRPRKRKFFKLMTEDGWNMTAEPFSV